MKIAQAGLMAALCYIGYAVFPAISASGSKDPHRKCVRRPFRVPPRRCLRRSFRSGRLIDRCIVSGYAASHREPFITKLVIGLIVGFVAHKIASFPMNMTMRM